MEHIQKECHFSELEELSLKASLSFGNNELKEISVVGSTTRYLGYEKVLLAKQQTTDLLKATFKIARSKRRHE